MRAGVFDSGVGGLSVLKSLLEHKLFKEVIYFGDTARVPYGVKDRNTIVRYSLEALEFFENFNIDILIVACNTVSAYAIKELKERSSVPVVGVIESGVLALSKIQISLDSNILVIGTKATIDSNRYEILLSKLGYKNITSRATSLFVPIVEEGLFSGRILDEVMEHYFADIEKPKAIILGCTHFPLIADAIYNYWNKDAILIHSGDAIVDYLKERYTFKPLKRATKIKYFASENPKGLKAIADRWLKM